MPCAGVLCLPHGPERGRAPEPPGGRRGAAPLLRSRHGAAPAAAGSPSQAGRPASIRARAAGLGPIRGGGARHTIRSSADKRSTGSHDVNARPNARVPLVWKWGRGSARRGSTDCGGGHCIPKRKAFHASRKRSGPGAGHGGHCRLRAPAGSACCRDVGGPPVLARAVHSIGAVRRQAGGFRPARRGRGGAQAAGAAGPPGADGGEGAATVNMCYAPQWNRLEWMEAGCVTPRAAAASPASRLHERRYAGRRHGAR